MAGGPVTGGPVTGGPVTGGSPTGVAVIGFAQSPCVRHGEGTTSGVEMLVPIFGEVLAATGLAKDEIGRASCRERVSIDV